MIKEKLCQGPSSNLTIPDAANNQNSQPQRKAECTLLKDFWNVSCPTTILNVQHLITSIHERLSLPETSFTPKYDLKLSELCQLIIISPMFFSRVIVVLSAVYSRTP